jgi:hypothetical protein
MVATDEPRTLLHGGRVWFAVVAHGAFPMRDI